LSSANFIRGLACRLASGATLFALTALQACYGTTSAYVEADAPVAVEAYPSTYYDGHVVYWTGDRWYLRDRGAWFYYRNEPAPLYRYRGHVHGNFAAPARERHYHRSYPRPYRRAAPPVRRHAPPARHHAPPARRH
jgi:hypothetical protein